MTRDLVGKRCRVISLARDHLTGAILRGRTGTIRSQRDNLGRTLLFVEWDDAAVEASFVFPSDIELLENTAPQQGGAP